MKARQRPLQPRQIAFQIDEPRARHLGGALEIHLAQRLADLEMLFGIVDRRAACRRRAPSTGTLALSSAPSGTSSAGILGITASASLQRLFQFALLGFALLDLVLQSRHFRHQRLGLGLVLLRLGLADQLGGFVAPRLLRSAAG